MVNDHKNDTCEPYGEISPIELVKLIARLGFQIFVARPIENVGGMYITSLREPDYVSPTFDYELNTIAGERRALLQLLAWAAIQRAEQMIDPEKREASLRAINEASQPGGGALPNLPCTPKDDEAYEWPDEVHL